ncbi:MAG: FHA domain-containing protein [Gemmataceae bacterium]
MTIRLRVTGPGGGLAVPFESSADSIRIGRDPACELALSGEISAGVSREHARISRAGKSTTLFHVSETNATLLNDKPVAKSAPLKAGDRIQLGYTGPTVEVLAIEPLVLAQAVSVAAPPAAKSAVPLIIAGVAVVALLIAGGVAAVVLMKGPGHASSSMASAPETTQTSSSKMSASNTTQSGTPAPAIPAVTPPEPIGYGVPHPDRVPSILMQQIGDLYPWASLGSYDRVRTNQSLMALPGFRCAVELDSKITLMLCGHLPEFDTKSANAAPAPVLESVIMLNKPAEGCDADFNLDRGRVRVENHKPSGPARVRAQFGSQKWDLVLPTEKSQVMLEWNMDPQRVLKFGKKTIDRFRLRLVATGGATVAGVKMPAPQGEIEWTEGMPATPTAKSLDKLPDWWTDKPDTKSLPEKVKLQVEETMLALQTWAEWLHKNDPPAYIVSNKIREEKAREAKDHNPTVRRLGLMFLPALDQPVELIGFLEDPQLEAEQLKPQLELRRAAAMALQFWVNRDPENVAILAKDLRSRKQYPADAAREVSELLQFVEKNEARSQARRVAGLLTNENPVVRTLAFLRLNQALPPEGRPQIPYDPTADSTERQKSALAWQQVFAR